MIVKIHKAFADPDVLNTSNGTEKIQFTRAENVSFIEIDDEDVLKTPSIK